MRKKKNLVLDPPHRKRISPWGFFWVSPPREPNPKPCRLGWPGRTPGTGPHSGFSEEPRRFILRPPVVPPLPPFSDPRTSFRPHTTPPPTPPGPPHQITKNPSGFCGHAATSRPPPISPCPQEPFSKGLAKGIPKKKVVGRQRQKTDEGCCQLPRGPKGRVGVGFVGPVSTKKTSEIHTISPGCPNDPPE